MTTGRSTTQQEPTQEQFLAALAAWDAVCADLDVTWEARQPIQGEATPKVFAYRLAKAALNAAALPLCAACYRPVPGEVCQRPHCPGNVTPPARTAAPDGSGAGG